MAAASLTFLLAGCQGGEGVNTGQTKTAKPPKVEVTQTETQVKTEAQVKSETILTQEQSQIAPKTTKTLPAKTQVKTTSKTTPKNTDKPAASPLKGITIKSDGFVPSIITVSPGTKVIFINVDDALHWPASDVHPTHGICPGFDSQKPLAKNGTYAFTFTEAKTCPFHDHLNPSLRGSVVVK